MPFVIVGGVMAGLSYLFMQFYLAWLSFIPLFYALERRNARQSFLYSALYGVIPASILYYWVIPVGIKYSGMFAFSSIAFYVGGILYFSLYYALFGIGYHFLHGRSETNVLSGISIAGLYVLLELLRMTLLPGAPWTHYTLACSQAKQVWLIQWAAIGGHSIIAFMIVLFAYSATQFLLRKETKLLTTAAGVIALYVAGGCVLTTSNGEIVDDEFRVALLNDNIPAAARWNDSTGDSLANVLFDLNHQAAQSDPDLIVWSETAVPWLFLPDDQFIPTALSITHRSKADHLLGIWSPSVKDRRLVYNSAYLIKNDGRIADRYDKTVLLDFLERPINAGFLSVLPFFKAGLYDNILPGPSKNVIASGKAKIGVLICNESLCEEMYAVYDAAKANLLVVMSNDAWFENTPLQMHHFHITRIGAVMIGRNVVVNSNRGIVGIIRGEWCY